MSRAPFVSKVEVEGKITTITVRTDYHPDVWMNTIIEYVNLLKDLCKDDVAIYEVDTIETSSVKVSGISEFGAETIKKTVDSMIGRAIKTEIRRIESRDKIERLIRENRDLGIMNQRTIETAEHFRRELQEARDNNHFLNIEIEEQKMIVDRMGNNSFVEIFNSGKAMFNGCEVPVKISIDTEDNYCYLCLEEGKVISLFACYHLTCCEKCLVNPQIGHITKCLICNERTRLEGKPLVKPAQVPQEVQQVQQVQEIAQVVVPEVVDLNNDIDLDEIVEILERVQPRRNVFRVERRRRRRNN